MNFIIDFYHGLDPLNTIIFWGVIIIILLLLVFAILMLNKNKKLKKELHNKNYHDELYSDEIALPSNSRDTLIMKDDELLIQEEKQTTFEPFTITEEPVQNEHIEVEKKFKAEEHVMKYDNELFNLETVKKNSEMSHEELPKESIDTKPTFQMPTKPYERNVLREMSLSQTSPIGIVKIEKPLNKPVTKPKDQVANSISKENSSKPITKEISSTKNPDSVATNFDKSTVIVDTPSVVSEIIAKSSPEDKVNHPNNNHYDKSELVNKTVHTSTNFSHNYETSSLIQPKLAPSLTNDKIIPQEITSYSEKKVSEPSQRENAKFLEEVSQKLAEAEVNDEIDRTAYELQQEEDAIISYKELMAKKDTIKTIDEEDAVISIKELTERKNATEKLYNITEEEENNEFIDELKKFRNDLN